MPLWFAATYKLRSKTHNMVQIEYIINAAVCTNYHRVESKDKIKLLHEKHGLCCIRRYWPREITRENTSLRKIASCPRHQKTRDWHGHAKTRQPTKTSALASDKIESRHNNIKTAATEETCRDNVCSICFCVLARMRFGVQRVLQYVTTFDRIPRY